MKFVVGEYGINIEKTYPDSISSITKPTLSYRDANSGHQRGRQVSNLLCHGAPTRGLSLVLFTFYRIVKDLNRGSRERQNNILFFEELTV